MNGPELLEHAADLVSRRRREYGEPVDVFEAAAKRWSLVFGTKITAAQVVIALLDLKLVRLSRDPKHLDSSDRRGRLCGGLAGADAMTGPASYRSCLARAQADRRPATRTCSHAPGGWRTAGRGRAQAEEMRDDWTRQRSSTEPDRLYGRRPGGEG